MAGLINASRRLETMGTRPAEMVALARRSAERRHAVPRRADEDLPARERALLEELGYIDAESAR